jgi:hypothetical protein
MTCAAVPLIARELSSAICGGRHQSGRVLEHTVAADDDGLSGHTGCGGGTGLLGDFAVS